MIQAVVNPANVPQAHGPAPSLYWIRNDITPRIKNIIQLNTCGVVFPLHVSNIYFQYPMMIIRTVIAQSMSL